MTRIRLTWLDQVCCQSHPKNRRILAKKLNAIAGTNGDEISTVSPVVMVGQADRFDAIFAFEFRFSHSYSSDRN